MKFAKVEQLESRKCYVVNPGTKGCGVGVGGVGIGVESPGAVVTSPESELEPTILPLL